MNSEEDEFKRIEAEIKRRAAQDEDDDTQFYTNENAAVYAYRCGYEAGAAAEREACAKLVWPKLKVWSEKEQTAMNLAFKQAQEKHGWSETLMAVGASVLKMKAEAIRARGQA